MSSSHLILCRPLLLLPPIPPSIRVFSNESTLHMIGQSTGVSALTSFLPKKSQGWSPSEWKAPIRQPCYVSKSYNKMLWGYKDRQHYFSWEDTHRQNLFILPKYALYGSHKPIDNMFVFTKPWYVLKIVWLPTFIRSEFTYIFNMQNK